LDYDFAGAKKFFLDSYGGDATRVHFYGKRVLRPNGLLLGCP